MPLLSVIVPVYNEAKTIRQILEKINSVDIDKEIIVIDDSSCDGTDKIIREFYIPKLKLIHHTTNRGKGAAFLTGLSHAQGEYILIQDADLEYDPADYPRLFEAIKDDKADIVLGARFQKGYHGLFIHRLGNRFLTGLINLLFGCRLNDYSTCYKILRKSTAESLSLKTNDFSIDVEIVTKSLKRGLRIVQVPVSYNPRTYGQGKKIRWNDGIHALISIIKYRLS